MKSIPVSELQANAYFNDLVYLDPDYVLLSPDVQVSPELLRRLERWGFDTVLCDGNQVDSSAYLAPGQTSASTSMLELDVKEKQSMDSARKLYFVLIKFMVETCKRFSESNKLNLAAVTEQLKSLIEIVKSSRDAILRFPEFVYLSDNYLHQHSVNTAILAVAIGDTLKLPPHRLIELGVGALLHDIGMFKIPESLYLTSKPLGPNEWKMIRAHPMLGYRILKGFSMSDTIALTAYEHHERMNGSGYPRALVGEKITLYSRITGLMDSYESMTAKRLFKPHLEGHPALLELVKGRKELYDETVFRALIQCLSLYPLGTTVLLSDGAMARVIGTDPQSPKTPTVQILVDRDGRRLEELAVAHTSLDGGQDAPAIKRNLTWKEVEAFNLY